MSNQKPIPSYLRYNLPGGWVAVDGETLQFDRKDFDMSGAQVEVAGILLALAQHLLNLNGNPEVSKRVLLEAGLLEATSLRDSSNDLKVLSKVKLSKAKKPLEEGEVKECAKSISTEIQQTLLASGVDPGVIRYFSTLNGYVHALNSSVNPAKAAKTMMAKAGFSARYTSWLKKNPAPAVPEDEESDFDDSEVTYSGDVTLYSTSRTGVPEDVLYQSFEDDDYPAVVDTVPSKSSQVEEDIEV